MKKENLKKNSPSDEVRSARIRLSKELLLNTTLNAVITIGTVAVFLALAPTLWTVFPAFAGLINGVGLFALIGGGLFTLLNLLVGAQAIGVIATGGRYYPGYIRIAGDDTKEEDLVEAHGVQEKKN